MLRPDKLKTAEDEARLDDWFEGRVRDADFSIHAFRLIADCFERAGRVPKLPEPQFWDRADRWLSVCWHVYHATWNLIESGDKDPLVSAVFERLCGYCLLSPKSPPGKRFAVLVSEFRENGHYNQRLISLMPPVFQAELPAIQVYIDQWDQEDFERESEMIRMGQYGY